MERMAKIFSFIRDYITELLAAQVLFVKFKRQHFDGGNIPAHFFPDRPTETVGRAERGEVNQRHHFSIDGIKGGDCLHESIYYFPDINQVNFWFFGQN